MFLDLKCFKQKWITKNEALCIIFKEPRRELWPKENKSMVKKLIYSAEATKVWQNLQNNFEIWKSSEISSYFCGILRIYQLYGRILQI